MAECDFDFELSSVENLLSKPDTALDTLTGTVQELERDCGGVLVPDDVEWLPR